MASQEEIAQQWKLLAIHRINLALYLEQREAQGGPAYMLPAVAHGIRQNRADIARIKGVLRKWGIDVANQEGDEEPPAEQSSDPTPSASRAGGGGGITFNIHGGDFRGSNLPIGNTVEGDLKQQIGGVTMSTFDQRGWEVKGDVYNIAGSMYLSAKPDKDELLTKMRQLHGELAKAEDLPANKASYLKEDLDGAIKAAEAPQPDKERTVEKLTSMQKMLDGLGNTFKSALALGKLVGEILSAAQGIHF